MEEIFMRKLLSVLLAVVMLALPAMSLAASPDEIMAMAENRTTYTEITFTSGNLPLSDDYATPISDLLNALSIGLVSGNEGETSTLAMGLSGKTVLTVDAQTKDDTLYLASSLLDNPVAFTADELQALMTSIMSSYNEAIGADETTATDTTLSLEDLTSLSDQMANVASGFKIDVDQVTAVLDRIAGRITTEAVTEQSKDHEPATTKTTLTVTAEDVSDIIKVALDAVQNNETLMTLLHQANIKYSFDGEEVTEEEFFTQLPERYEEALSHYGDITAVILQNDAGETVHVELSAEAKDDSVLPIEMAYNRLGTADGMGHSFTFTLTNNSSDSDAQQMALSADWLTDAEKTVSFNAAVSILRADGTVDEFFSFTASGTKEYGDTEASSDVTYTMAVSSDGTEESRMSFSMQVSTTASFDGKDAMENETVTLSMNSSDPMLTINVAQATGDAADNIDGTNAVHPITMTEDELNTYLSEVQTSAMTNLAVILQNLPSSVLNLLTSSTAE
jgi:hypothetical protein